MSTPAASGCSTGNVAVVFLLLVLRAIFPQHFLPRAARPDREKSGNLLNGIGGLSKQASVTTVLTTQPGATLGNGLRGAPLQSSAYFRSASALHYRAQFLTCLACHRSPTLGSKLSADSGAKTRLGPASNRAPATKAHSLGL